ncbi:apolipoprotein N-acyltransferase [candidate division KSB1 bacterium]
MAIAITQNIRQFRQAWLCRRASPSWVFYARACGLGVLLAAAYPPFPFGFLAYAGLIPFLYWMRGESASMPKGMTLPKAFKLGYWWGFGFHTAGLYWINVSTVLGGVSALLFLPVFSAVTLLLCRSLYRNYGTISVFFFPFLWTAVEYIRSLGVLAFPWMNIGYTQTYYLPMVQFAEYLGVHGVVFWLCVINVVLFILIEQARSIMPKTQAMPFGKGIAALINMKTGSLAVIAIALLIVPWIYGKSVIDAGEYRGDSIKVALIQGHIDTEIKKNAEYREENYRIYEQLTLRAAEEEPDLIVWPETSTLAYIRIAYQWQHRFRSIAQLAGAPVLAGSPDVIFLEDGSYKPLNSAVLLNRFDENFDEAQWYAKMRLVPLGEWFPYEDRFSFLENIDFGQGNFKPGTDYTVFSLERRKSREMAMLFGAEASGSEVSSPVDSVQFSVAVCFESIFPDFIRIFCKAGSRFLVVVSNVAWFGRTTSLYQHPQIGVFRAIENRIGVAHCSNSGISVLIDPYGRVTDKSSVYKKEILIGRTYFRDNAAQMTFFTRNGDLIGPLSAVISTVLLLAGLITGCRRKGKARKPGPSAQTSV